MRASILRTARTAFTPSTAVRLTSSRAIKSRSICPSKAQFPTMPTHVVHRQTLSSSSTPPTAPPTPESRTPSTSETAKKQLTLLYDGDCPLCMREVNFLRGRSTKYGDPINFVDIASPEYDPSVNGGISYEVAMGRIHGITGEGNILEGVTVFRAAYNAVGLGWVYSITTIPAIGWVADKIYDAWADRRLQWTGRPPLEEVLAARRTQKGETCRTEE